MGEVSKQLLLHFQKLHIILRPNYSIKSGLNGDLATGSWSALRAPQQRTGARPAGRRGQVTRGLSLSFLSCEMKGSDLWGQGVSKVCHLPPRRDQVPNMDGKPPVQWPLSETIQGVVQERV